MGPNIACGEVPEVVETGLTLTTGSAAANGSTQAPTAPHPQSTPEVATAARASAARAQAAAGGIRRPQGERRVFAHKALSLQEGSAPADAQAFAVPPIKAILDPRLSLCQSRSAVE
jgi:hypothetical protein